MGFTQSGFTTSVPHTLDEQSRHIAYILRQVVDHGIRSFAATQGVRYCITGLPHRAAGRARKVIPG